MSLISQVSQDTVSGYVHQIEESSQIQNIPAIVVFTILAFYAKPNEYFSPNVADCIKLSNDNKTITKISLDGSLQNTSYGNLWIDSMSDKIIKWEFKIDANTTKEGGICYNIVAKEAEPEQNVDGLFLDPDTYMFHQEVMFTFRRTKN